jgi:replication-associated recombination protein RarA
VSRPDLPPTGRGYDVRECVSAYQKAIRRSQVDDALYWGAELYKAGYPDWAWKRLRIIASEDVGVAAPAGFQADIEALYARYVDFKRKLGTRASADEGLFWFTHATILAANAPKSRLVDLAFMHHASDSVPRREIPDEALDVHTRAGKARGRGWQHFLDESGRLIQPENANSDLAALEAEYQDHFRRRIADDADQPHNPWRAESNLPKSHTAPTGQLSIETETTR